MDNDYEKNKMSGDKDTIANNTVGLIGTILRTAAEKMDNIAEKVVLLGGSTIPGISGLAIIFARPENQDRMCKHQTPDDILFGALYVAASVEGHPDGIICGYSLDMIQRAKDTFKMLTDREYTNIHPNLQQMLDERLVKTVETIPDHLKKFVS